MSMKRTFLGAISTLMLACLVLNTSGTSRLPETPCDNPEMAEGPTDPMWPKVLAHSAHELRSPLTVIVGRLRMLLNERAGPLNDTQRGHLEEFEKSCGRLRTLLDEMSALSELEAGNAPFNRTTREPARHPYRDDRGAARTAGPAGDDRP